MILELESPGISARFSTAGARLMSCVVDGVETTFGPRPEPDVLAGDIYAGVVCGRHAGRITHAGYELDGRRVALKPNMGPHQLHGGDEGFHQRRWDYLRDGNRIIFMLQSPDGEGGFPGNMDVKAVYALSGNTLSLDIVAHTTQATVANITNHAYWNLAGKGHVLDHELQINGSHYFPLTELLLPTGEIKPVAGTRFDFRKARPIAEDYDNCIKLDGPRGQLQRAMILRDPASGRRMEVWTSEGCLQFYTAIHWGPELVGHKGPLSRSMALAIEPQNVADAVNHGNFPSSVLRPGEAYRNRIEWRFF